VPSEPLNLQVSVLDQAHLPPPVVPEADASDTLDLTRLVGDASVTVEAWPLIALGQRYWIKVSGTLNTGMPHSFYVARNRVPTANEVVAGLDKPMLRTELENLKDSTELTVEVRVAFDGVGNESSAIAFPTKTYTVKSLEIVTPIIDSVVDDKDRTIPNNGATTATTVTLKGTASIRRQVEIFNSGTSLGTAMSDDTGAWNKTVTDLTRGGHSFTAIGRYGDGDDPESDPFAITVVEVVKPIIDRVADDRNRGISNGGSTTATSVLVRGTASIRQRVEIFNGDTSLGTVTSDDLGIWRRTAPDLASAVHSFTAIGLYDDDPKSDPFEITVVDVVTPVINRVTDDKGDIAEGGVTTATTVTLHGIASIRQQVEILNGGTSLGTETSDAAGGWTRRVTGLSFETHSFTAQGLYDNNPVSPARTITVRPATVCEKFTSHPVGHRFPAGEPILLPSGTSFAWHGTDGGERYYPLEASIVSANGSRALQCSTTSMGFGGAWSCIKFTTPAVMKNLKRITITFDARGIGKGWSALNSITDAGKQLFNPGTGIILRWELTGPADLYIGSHHAEGESLLTLVIREICWE
jgi:hypothetical protein